MNTMTSNFSFIKVSGIDAKKFLQGQLTCDMDTITSAQDHLGAHCSPQGRVISLFTISRHADEAYYLLMQSDLAPIALSALKKYAIFYKTQLEIQPTSVPPAYHLTLLRRGIPTLYPETSGKFLPHELNLHLLNAISFNKGCYTGQEIIARMHYRGKLKKHLHLASIASDSRPSPSADLFGQDNGVIQPKATIVDSIKDATTNQYLILLLCEDSDAKNDYLFLASHNQLYLTLIPQAGA